MTKPDSSKPETGAPDYSQMATDMLQMWQQGWKSYSDMMTKTAPAAEPSATADPFTGPFTGAPNWLEPWGRFMAGWAATNTPSSPSTPPSYSADTPVETATEMPTETHAQPAPQREQETQPEQPAATGDGAGVGPETVSAAARSAPQPRDVLFAELVRRVEFLHERMVRMEAELERLKRRL